MKSLKNTTGGILALLLISGCASTVPYVEYSHISSIPNGIPFNGLPETQADQVFLGMRHHSDSGLYLDTGVGVNVGESELEGRNPWGRFAIGYEFK